MTTTATAAAPAAPKTAAAPAAAKTSTPPAKAAKTPESPATKAPPKGKSKPQTKAKAPPQTPAGDKAEASAKAAVKEAMSKNLPAGAQGNTSAEHKAKQEARGMGHNSIVTHAEIEEAAQSAGASLGSIMKGDDRIQKTKAQADTLRKEAASTLYPIFERLGIEQGTEAKDAKKIEEYEKLRMETCQAMAKKAGVKLEYTTKGTPKIPGAINKHWSRLFRSYNEGGEGGQTKADKNAREAAKQRTKTATAKAEALDNILVAYAAGNSETVDTMLKAAKGRWGSALNI